MPLDNLTKDNTLDNDVADTDAVNGTKDTISGNRKPKSSPSTGDSASEDTDAIQDALNEDDKSLTPAQKKAQLGLAKQKGEVDGQKKEKKEGSLRIHIDLDLEVEIHLTARVKGDITIGLL